jgi:hypothetical protein
MINEGFEVRKLSSTKRVSTPNVDESNLAHSVTFEDYFCLRFATLTFTMYVDGMMLIGIKVNNNSKIFVQLWHGIK